MKIALVHDFLREYGGAERVVEALHDMFPEAPLYTAFVDWQALGKHASRFKNWDIRETKIAELPLYKKLFSPYRIFAAWAFEQLDLSEFDVVISSSNMYMAKAVKVRSDAKHFAYIHTPPRSLYGYTTRTNWQEKWWTKIPGELINVWMRYVDFTSAQRPDVLVANSFTTQQRIKKFWRRDSIIIPPPVAMVEKLPKMKMKQDRDYLLFVGRLVWSKHPEVAVAVANELKLPLKVAGVGPLLAKLQESAGKTTEFLGAVSDERLQELYQGARLVLFPAEDEDFGIVPIEAMACGAPVIAHQSGEPAQLLSAFPDQLVVDYDLKKWSQAVKRAWQFKWDSQNIALSVVHYGADQFAKAIKKLI